jgi:hypothetical protein
MNATRSWWGDVWKSFSVSIEFMCLRGFGDSLVRKREGLKCFSLIEVDCEYWESSEHFIEIVERWEK